MESVDHARYISCLWLGVLVNPCIQLTFVCMQKPQLQECTDRMVHCTLANVCSLSFIRICTYSCAPSRFLSLTSSSSSFIYAQECLRLRGEGVRCRTAVRRETIAARWACTCYANTSLLTSRRSTVAICKHGRCRMVARP